MAIRDGRLKPEQIEIERLRREINKLKAERDISKNCPGRCTPAREVRLRGYDVANEMDIEDGVISVYGFGEDGVMAFTDFGIENLVDLIKMRKDHTPLNHPGGDK